LFTLASRRETPHADASSLKLEERGKCTPLQQRSEVEKLENASDEKSALKENERIEHSNDSKQLVKNVSDLKEFFSPKVYGAKMKMHDIHMFNGQIAKSKLTQQEIDDSDADVDGCKPATDKPFIPLFRNGENWVKFF